METMTIGEVARATGLKIQTLRFYEDKGLLEVPARRSSGYREYSESAITRLKFIKRAKELGFSLKEIGELLALRVDPDATCAEIRNRAEAKIGEVRNKIRSLKRIEKALVKVTSACRGKGPTSDCPILDALEKETE